MRVVKRVVLAVAVVVMSGGAFAAGADEISDLKKQLSELQAKVAQLEAQQTKAIVEEVNKAVEKKQTALPDTLKWAEKVKISGDIRYRHESIDEQSSGDWKQGVNRHRLRARVGIDGKVNEDVDLGFRLASGSADPVSSNQDLDDSFSKKAIWLDLAYFDWHPAAMKGFDFVGGKMLNPFYTVGRNELIWDVDLNPEGLAAKYEKTLSETLKLNLNGGGFWVEERDADGGVDCALWGVQGYLKNKFNADSYLLGGMSYFDYGNIEGTGDIYTAWKGGTTKKWFGNTQSGGVFAYDYDIVEGFAEYGFKMAEFPVVLFGDYAHNAAAPGSKSNGWLLGLTFNKCKDPGSWEIGYDYRDIDSDAVVGQFNASDFVGGGTNGRGHRFGLAYQLAKNFQTALTYFLDERKDADKNDYRRLEADLIFKF